MENLVKVKKREFKYDLFWYLIEVINHMLMTLAAAVMCRLCDLHFQMNTSMRMRTFASLMLFLVFYIIFSHIYEGLRVSVMRVSEMIYSQMLSCFFSDALLYMVLWLISGRLAPVWYMLLVLVMQFLLAFLWSYLANKLYFRTNQPRKTALVYNKRSGIKKLISEYGLGKKYQVEKIFSVNDVIKDLSVLGQYETVFMTDIHSKERNKILKYCVENNVQMFLIPRVGDTLMSGAKPRHMFHLPILEVSGYRPSPYYRILKRLFDIVVSLLALILLSPVFLVTSIAIKATDGGPVFYKQERMTQYGRNFMIHKFRSMRVDAEKDGVARLSTGADDDRITPVGKLIRACRIDELPQLIDILKGDLSVVGPRPEREAIAREYEKEMPEFRLRLKAKAGLTGYAQVYGKYNTTPYDKLQMDLMYIAHPSILQDLKICFATVKILFLPESTEGVAAGAVNALDTEEDVDE